jgi:hypothetical protein
MIPDTSKPGSIVWLYLTLVHITSAFSLFIVMHGSSSMLQHPGYSRSVSVFSLTVNTTISDLTISEFISRTTNLRKQIE